MDSAAGEIVGSVHEDDPTFLEPNSMQMREVDGHSLALVRTEKGVFAIDNACPHQGYGLVTGELGVDGAGDAVVTCLWHNWKFRVNDGVCVLGEEDVACHHVMIDDAGTVRVRINRRSPEEQLSTLWPSLRSGIKNDYVGQVARDTVRLLDNGATPAQVMAAALHATVEHTEDGADHEVALAADCLAMAEERSEDDRVLPLVVGMAGLAEQTRDRAAVTAEPRTDGTLAELIEIEDVHGAMGLAAALDLDTARKEMVEAAARHHLGYGHGAIYTQKVFEVLSRVGPALDSVLLPQLARSLTLMTREDLLPYMRKTTRAIADVDLERLAESPRTVSKVPEHIVTEFLDAKDPGIERAAELAHQGLGVEGLIDIASLGSARRMLRYRTSNELDVASNFNWLSITHGLTHARATRWAWHNEPGPHSARMALHALWLLHDTGRLERREGSQQPRADSDPALAQDRNGFARVLEDEAMDDRGGSFIVVAHLVKTARAAAEESAAMNSLVPLQAAERFIRGDRRERFVARNVAESVRFVRTGTPPKR
ncbi:MAG: Rieske (2Fe-2S) protein [Acidimicrobiales bacterium]